MAPDRVLDRLTNEPSWASGWPARQLAAWDRPAGYCVDNQLIMELMTLCEVELPPSGHFYWHGSYRWSIWPNDPTNRAECSQCSTPLQTSLAANGAHTSMHMDMQTSFGAQILQPCQVNVGLATFQKVLEKCNVFAILEKKTYGLLMVTQNVHSLGQYSALSNANVKKRFKLFYFLFIYSSLQRTKWHPFTRGLLLRRLRQVREHTPFFLGMTNCDMEKCMVPERISSFATIWYHISCLTFSVKGGTNAVFLQLH